jgi:Asp-tRNA(Asn)/Glu-tRNA(Gln) amidotransferase A subunit family amidase
MSQSRQCHRAGAANRCGVDLFNLRAGFYTAPYNLTGSPALSVPIGFENGLPLAQIAGKPFDEAR